MNLKDTGLFHEACYIDGTWFGRELHERIPVENPSNRSEIGSVPSVSRDEVSRAISAAQRAFEPWKNLTAKDRSVILRKWYDLVLAHVDDLAAIVTTEQGKSLREAKGEVLYAASFLEFYAEEAKRIYGEMIPTPRKDRRILVQREPVGVCAAITPWNFPAAMITRKVAPALASGCTMILKPAEETPFSALALCELAHRAGVPKGVFNVITGAPEMIGEEFSKSSIVRKLSFTGSTEVGKLLYKQCGDTVKKLTLELGGHAPFIVFDDADVQKAVEGAMASKFRNSGQTCICANRFFVQEKVFGEFETLLTEAVRKLKVGDGFEEHCDQGPLIHEEAVKKVQSHISDALNRGAHLVVGGKPHSRGGNFFEPTILRDVTKDMIVMNEETFGPVAPLVRFDSEEEAVSMANDTPYGLAAYFYARDVGRIMRVSESLEYGMVAVNTGIFSTEVAPFGGVKESGLGREGSKFGIDEYVHLKYICLAGL